MLQAARRPAPGADAVATFVASVRGARDGSLRAALERFCLVDGGDGAARASFGALPRDALCDALADDAWLRNVALNHWEAENRVVELESRPTRITVPVSDICNARCTFCHSWLHGRDFFPLAALDALREPLRWAQLVDLAGYGEPLIHPGIDELLARLARIVEPRCSFALFTNGAVLHRFAERLVAMNVSDFNVSLNAASAEVHEAVMGLGPDAFDRVVGTIGHLLDLRRRTGRDFRVALSAVVVRENLRDLPALILLANRLGVDAVFLRTLQQQAELVPGLNYHLLPPTGHPDFAALRDVVARAIALSAVPVIGSPDSWDVPVLPPSVRARVAAEPPAVVPRQEALVRFKEKARLGETPAPGGGRGRRVAGASATPFGPSDDPYGRTAPFACAYPYRHLILTYGALVPPCCYMRDVPGHEPMHLDPGVDVATLWNSPAMVELRRTLADGPLLRGCRVCPLGK